MRKINQYFNDDELLDIHDVITENLPIRFDSDGAPTKRIRIFEQIIDIFYDELDI